MSTHRNFRRKHPLGLPVLAGIVFLLAAGTSFASTIYNIGGSSGDYADLQEMLDDTSLAIADGDTIVINNNDASITNNANPVLNGIFIGNNLQAKNLTLTSGTTVSTIQSADTRIEFSTNAPDYNRGGNGGGFLQINGSIAGYTSTGNTLSDLAFSNWDTFSQSPDTFKGGAVIFMKGTNNNILDGLTFSDNSVETRYAAAANEGGGGGGAVYLSTDADNNLITANVFDNNWVTTAGTDAVNAGGGALYLFSNKGNRIEDSVFINNVADINNANSGGGAVYMRDATGVVIDGVLFGGENSGNLATTDDAMVSAYGGALFAQDSAIRIVADSGETAFIGNQVQALGAGGNAFGGAAYLDGTSLYMKGVQVEGNTALSERGPIAAGGGFYVDGTDSVQIVATTFSENTVEAEGSGSSGYGGGLYLGAHTGTHVITDSVFENNLINALDNAYGGGIYNADGNLKLSSPTANSLKGNVVNANDVGGAGIWSGGGELTIDREYFIDNIANGSDTAVGGGIGVGGGTLVLTQTDVTGNQANGAYEASGGGVFIEDTAFTGTIANNDISGNSATSVYGGAYGGGIANANELNALALTNNTIDNNAVTGLDEAYGGGIANESGVMDITGGSISDNVVTATDSRHGVALGGGIYTEAGVVTLTNVNVTGNAVDGNTALGAGIFMNTGDILNGATEATLNLVSTTGTMVVGDNTVNNDSSATGGNIYIGNENIGADSDFDAYLNLEARNSSVLEIENIVVLMNGGRDFTQTVSGSGKVHLSGTNRYTLNSGTLTDSTTVLDFSGGNTFLSSTYTAILSGDSHAEVILDDTTLVIAVPRANSSTPIFDFQNGDGSNFDRLLTVGNNVVLEGTLHDLSTGDRPVYSMTTKYVLASGLTLTEQQAQTQIIDKISFGSTFEFLNLDHLDYVIGSNGLGTLSAQGTYVSPFASNGPNGIRSLAALDQLVNDTFPPQVSNDEWNAMLVNPRALYSELYLNHAYVTVDTVDRIGENAMDMGLRNFHHNALRLGPAMLAANRVNRGRERYEDCYTPSVGAGGFRVWAQYVGDFRRNRAKGGFNGFDVDRHGFLVGFNYDFGMAGSIGVFGGYTHGKSKDRAINAHIKQDMGHFGIQGRISPIAAAPQFSIYADFGYHFAKNDSDRHYSSANRSYSASGDFDQHLFTVGLGAEYVISMGSFNLTPFAKFRFTHLNQDHLNETGNAATTTYNSGFNESSFQHRLGLEASYDFVFGSNIISPVVDVAWKHYYNHKNYTTSTFYNMVPGASANPAIRFRTSSTDISRDTLDIGVGVKSAFTLSGGNQLGAEAMVNMNMGSKSFTTSVYAGAFLSF